MLKAMYRVVIVNYCLGFLGLLLFSGMLNVEGRNVFNSENRVLNPKGDANVQSKFLSLLLHRTLVPVERNDPLVLELANKLVELEGLEALRQDLELEREITTNLVQDKPITRKRGEPCFWKYCV